MENSNLESTREFFDTWVKIYEATVGRMTEIPAMGPAREKSENVMKGLPIFFNLYTTWIETIADYQNISMEAMRRMGEKTGKMEGEITQERYKELYNIWIESYSDTFKEFLKSGHFATDMGKFMENFIEAQKYNREMLEENYLKPSNLPTKTDIDEINKELYFLRKQVKELSAKLNELSTGR